MEERKKEDQGRKQTIGNWGTARLKGKTKHEENVRIERPEPRHIFEEALKRRFTRYEETQRTGTRIWTLSFFNPQSLCFLCVEGLNVLGWGMWS